MVDHHASGNELVYQAGKVCHIIYGREFHEEALIVIHTAFRFVLCANHVTHRGFFISHSPVTRLELVIHTRVLSAPAVYTPKRLQGS
jgi:hypothetical protein